MFGGAGREYRWKYGTKRETFAKISVEGAQARGEQPVRALQRAAHASRRSSPRPRCSIRSRATSAARRPAARPRPSSAPTSSRRSTASRSPVYIAAQAMTTDYASSFEDDCMIKMVGYDMAGRRAKKVYEKAGVGPKDVQRRRAPRLLHRQRAPHLRGARPLQGGRGREVHLGRRQHLRRQVRHEPLGRPALEGPPARRDRPRAVHRARLAAPRHRPTSARSTDAKVALQHNLGLGGACVVTMYRATDPPRFRAERANAAVDHASRRRSCVREGSRIAIAALRCSRLSTGPGSEGKPRARRLRGQFAPGCGRPRFLSSPFA